MKRLGMVAAAASLVLALGTATFGEAGTVGKRQVRQQTRIHNGIVNGELTRGETRFLEQEQARIQRAKRNAWSDGSMGPHEHWKLNRLQNAASSDIYRLKHNDLVR